MVVYNTLQKLGYVIRFYKTNPVVWKFNKNHYIEKNIRDIIKNMIVIINGVTNKCLNMAYTNAKHCQVIVSILIII